MADFHLSIITSQKAVFDDEVTALTLPGVGGGFGILAHHAPIVAALKDGNVVIRKGNTEVKLHIDSGFLEMSNNKATLLCDGMDDLSPLKPLLPKDALDDD